MARPIALLPTLLGAIAALALLGCGVSVSTGGESTTERITEQIEQAYEDRTGFALRGFACAEVEQSEEAAISCEGRNSAGVELVIEGEITNVEGSEFDYHWDVVRAVAPGSGYAKAAVPVVERLAGEPVAGVRCQRRVVVEVGQTVDCEVKTERGEIVPIQLRLTDDEGGFEVLTDGQSGQATTGSATSGA